MTDSCELLRGESSCLEKLAYKIVHTFVITRPRLTKIKENKSSRHQEVAGPVNSPLSRSCGANVKVVNCLVESLCGGKMTIKQELLQNG